MGWSYCLNCSVLDVGCTFGARLQLSLQGGECVGVASWPTPLVLGVRQHFGTWSRNLRGNMRWNSATFRLSTLAVSTRLSSNPVLRRSIMILSYALGKTGSRCDSGICN